MTASPDPFLYVNVFACSLAAVAFGVRAWQRFRDGFVLTGWLAVVEVLLALYFGGHYTFIILDPSHAAGVGPTYFRPFLWLLFVIPAAGHLREREEMADQRRRIIRELLGPSISDPRRERGR